MTATMKDMIFGTIGGLALFLFGMGLLSEGLKKIAGNRLRSLLEKLTKHRIVALLIGAAVTCIVQSSSVTTVTVVGLVNAGLLALRQAICVVLGANIGTTFTAWLVSIMSVFKITHYALPAVAVGLGLQLFSKRQRNKYYGQIILGFGILFLGLSFMKEAFSPLRHDPNVQKMLIAVGHNPILAVLVGAALTMIIQSSSASIAMIQVLAFSGAFGTDWTVAFSATIPFVLGDNIGTTITAQIAALRTNMAGKRTAMAHTMFNVIGVAIILPLVYLGWFQKLIMFITPARLTQNTVMMYIAVAHSTFNVVNSMLFLPIVSVLEKIVTLILPVKDSELEMRPVTLERNLLDTPPVAMDQARRELAHMAETAKSALEDAVVAIRKDDRSKITKVLEKEDVVDQFQTEITRYLAELSQRTLPADIANKLPVLLHAVNDVERISDHAVNITEAATRKIDQKYRFSPAATEEIDKITQEVREMFSDILLAIRNDNIEAAKRALEHENTINRMQMDFRKSHTRRLGEGTCSPMAGLLFIDFVDNMEKIGDHLTNIAQSVIGGLQWDGMSIPEVLPSATS
ncbi:MAG: Na/Pi cotransporter family protein [Planctomycetes bacterium]|nr:Na/Pi cotransporter family protein [Planctomycetota bacterium]